VALAVIAPLVVRVCRAEWARADREAHALRATIAERGTFDARAAATFAVATFALIVIYYYGDYEGYRRFLLPVLAAVERRHRSLADTRLFDQLYWRIWWSGVRVAAYLSPLLLWRVLFRTSPRDLGLRVGSLRGHLWIYLGCVVILVPVVTVVSRAPDFQRYYPFYDHAGRSWFDFAGWEAAYVAQFFGIEVFYRGFLLHGARTLGSAAIFASAIPYVMIHFDKPILEVCGAAVAAVVLGTLSLRTRSVYLGFLLHGTIALFMDLMALERRHQLPRRLEPHGADWLVVASFQPLTWTAWAACVLALLFMLYRRRRTRG
jgi:hypothetical protein